jgi:glycosyltransferase involved in cell wall biosynthesis
MEIFKTEPCDVVVCHSAWAQAVFGPVARSASLPLIFWLHNSAQGTHWLERWAKWTRPDGVICNSRFTAGYLTNLYQGIPAKVIHCPVTIPDQSSSRAERQATREELQVPAEAVVIIQVSRLEPLKGHRLHLEALARLGDLETWECWLAGGVQRTSEQYYLQEIKDTVRRLRIEGRVRFLGQRSDVPRLLTAADIFCQPNTDPDSFGITFIEGLLAQLPVVTTAMGGSLEIVDSSCGFLVPRDDAAALAACLRRLIMDVSLRSRLGLAGPHRARQLCDPGRQIPSVFDFVHRVLSREVAA